MQHLKIEINLTRSDPLPKLLYNFAVILLQRHLFLHVYCVPSNRKSKEYIRGEMFKFFPASENFVR